MMSRQKVRSSSAVLTALLWPVCAAAANIVDIAWTADSRFVHKTQIAAGKFVEICGKVSAGEAVRWSFNADALLDFNIHYHVGKDVVFPAKRAQVSGGQDVLKASVAQDYCWMWTNKTASSESPRVEEAQGATQCPLQSPSRTNCARRCWDPRCNKSIKRM